MAPFADQYGGRSRDVDIMLTQPRAGFFDAPRPSCQVIDFNGILVAPAPGF